MIRTKPYKGDTKKVAVILPEEILNMNNNALLCGVEKTTSMATAI